MLAGVFPRGGGRYPSVVSTTPRRCVVDLGDGINGLEWSRKILGDDCNEGVVSLELDGATEADDAGAEKGSVRY
jgi:hypothetical protein